MGNQWKYDLLSKYFYLKTFVHESFKEFMHLITQVRLKSVFLNKILIDGEYHALVTLRPHWVKFKCSSIFYVLTVVPANLCTRCCCCLVAHHIQLFATPWSAACQASLSFTLSQSLLKLKSIESMILSNHLILCCPFSSCLQSFPASRSLQRVGSLHHVAKEPELLHQSFQWIFRVGFLLDWLV